jgi:hypothetical protein
LVCKNSLDVKTNLEYQSIENSKNEKVSEAININRKSKRIVKKIYQKNKINWSNKDQLDMID